MGGILQIFNRIKDIAKSPVRHGETRPNKDSKVLRG
jgi:hypothetical protein